MVTNYLLLLKKGIVGGNSEELHITRVGYSGPLSLKLRHSGNLCVTNCEELFCSAMPICNLSAIRFPLGCCLFAIWLLFVCSHFCCPDTAFAIRLIVTTKEAGIKTA